MESAIKTIVTTFLSSAKGKEGLDSKTFQKMVKSKLSGIMEDTDSSSAIKEMQQNLDSDSDGKVDFQEYLSLIGYIANSMSQSKSEQTPNSS
ncbi:protein S100-A1 [Poecilia formosa]|uniref:protein S100-A1 n=1 Tax=Poecilia formosa TaxID=48698 RepID=UPI000443F200|nr:PREDICTED: protein S100-A1-like [Poecilia formosa]